MPHNQIFNLLTYLVTAILKAYRIVSKSW